MLTLGTLIFILGTLNLSIGILKFDSWDSKDPEVGFREPPGCSYNPQISSLNAQVDPQIGNPQWTFWSHKLAFGTFNLTLLRILGP